MTSEEVKKVIKSFNKKKSTISSHILVKVLIDCGDTYLPIFTDIINSTFPEELKIAEVTTLFKKAGLFDKIDYRPALSHVLKVCKRIIFYQISRYLEPYLSGLLTGFQKNHNTQHSLLKILELWKEALDKDNSVGPFFMDL